MKKTEALSTAKTEFIRNMSHDIRTPLTGIIGMAKMIGETPDAAETQEGAQDIHQAGIALLTLLNEIIETAQIEFGELSYENLVFKFLRRSGHIEKLFDTANKETDKELSVERTIQE